MLMSENNKYSILKGATQVSEIDNDALQMAQPVTIINNQPPTLHQLSINQGHENSNSIFTCDVCNKSYRQEIDYRHHLLQEHGKGTKFECSDCDKCFVTAKQLYTHQKSSHPSYQFLCVECGDIFQDKFSLTSHGKNHSVKNITCELCGQSFKTKSRLEQHFKQHEMENSGLVVGIERKSKRTLSCDTCQRSFFNNEHLNSHVCKHHACDICDMKFLKFKNLKYHKLVHEGKTIFSCDVCESLFQSR